MFSSQKSQQAVYSGLDEAQSSLEIRGGVILIGDPTGDGTVTQVTFTLSNALGGAPIDFTEPLDEDNDGLADANSKNRVVVSYTDKHNRQNNLHFQAVPCANSNDNQLLEPGEQFQITVTNLADALDTPLSTNTQFTLELKPPTGPVITLQRTTPPLIKRVMNLL